MGRAVRQPAASSSKRRTTKMMSDDDEMVPVVDDDDDEDEDDDDEEGEGGTEEEDEAEESEPDSDAELQTMKSSAAGRAAAAMPASERERKISDIIRCILALDTSAAPIRRETIRIQCFSSDRDKPFTRAINALIFYASKRLDEVFGMKLVDIPVGRDLEAAAAAHQDGLSSQQGSGYKATQQVWVVMNTLSHAQKEVSVSLSAKENAKMGLLMFILAMIHMKDNTLLEADLWKHLKKLGVEEKSKHPVFGQVPKLFKDLVKERFLVRNKSTSSTDGATFEYKWGSRAYKELSPLDVYEFVAEMFGEDADSGLLKRLEQLRKKAQRVSAGTELEVVL